MGDKLRIIRLTIDLHSCRASDLFDCIRLVVSWLLRFNHIPHPSAPVHLSPDYYLVLVKAGVFIASVISNPFFVRTTFETRKRAI